MHMTLRPISTERACDRDRLRHLATIDPTEAYAETGSAPGGLTPEKVASSREENGANTVSHARRDPVAKQLLLSFADPFTGILIVLAIVSLLTDVVLVAPADRNPATPIIITAMVLLSGILRFVQEKRSGDAAAALASMISTTCNVERPDTGRAEIPLDQVVVGDIVHLSAGDIVPADLRIVVAKDLFVSQSSLTGESVPVEKVAHLSADPEGSITDMDDLAFLGSTVVSGAAAGIVIACGGQTLFGEMTGMLEARPKKTSFDLGIESVSRLLIRFMLVMAPIVFVVNGLTKGSWLDALLFALSVAVGLTPEMLPMLVTSCLAKGAVDLSRDKVIVKKLDAIQNLGSIDVLCTDKTGTLTEDRVVLERHLDVAGHDDPRVLRYAFLNSFFETGLRNLIDSAIIRRAQEEGARNGEEPSADELADTYYRIDELPFDFDRRRVSVVVGDEGGHTRMITKGAVEEVLAVCSTVEYEGRTQPLTPEMAKLVMGHASQMADEGMRVLGVARKDEPAGTGELTTDDERDMTLIGYLAFLDPPKASAADAIAALAAHGVATKVLTGDSALVTCHVCRAIGIPAEGVLTGSDIEGMPDEELSRRVQEVTIFAKLSPDQKARVVAALRGLGHSVGYMGDGVNDAAAMRESDCGISVDTAVDVAKETADIILLKKDLMVLERGIVEGRRTYGNMIKYIKMTASSNFGNIFSVLLASAFLPFLPMQAVHLLLLNLIYDVSCSAIPWDNVDEEFLARPRTWDVGSIGAFMRWIGPTSSVFDIVCYLVLFFVVCPAVCGGPWADVSADPTLRLLFVGTFQAGWFVESMCTQTLVVHMIRTPKVPFLQSHAAAPLTLLGLAGITLAVVIPYTPVGTALGFFPLPGFYYLWLVGIVCAYMVLVTFVKRAFVHRHGELL
jgi:Mg2+-importing ATPase